MLKAASNGNRRVVILALDFIVSHYMDMNIATVYEYSRIAGKKSQLKYINLKREGDAWGQWGIGLMGPDGVCGDEAGSL